jgi:acetate kinase
MGIRLMQEKLPGIPNVAVFDTSFHSTIPEKAFTYPLPIEYRQMQMRKFGFHGTSVQYVVQHAKSILDSSNQHGISARRNVNDIKLPYNFVVCHLGSGASVTAVVGNESRDTSMGFTPLAGLMMGTRCGSVDPSLVGYACHVLSKSVDDVMDDWNKRSGLRGMVTEGQDYDMRSLLSRESYDTQAQLAVEMFVYRLAQHVASAMIALDGPMDALIFTAGIGEHSADIRRRTLQALQGTILQNAKIDEGRNSKDGLETSGIISADGSFPILLNVPTDEEAMIAREAIRIVSKNTN